MKKVICPYCGKRAEYIDSASIYHGRSYGMIYLCRACDAYVGVHDGTDIPKGSLANAELRYWRRLAHAAFDPMWQSGRFYHRRNAAYSWLAEKMELPKESTHIGMFDTLACKKVINIIGNEICGGTT